MFCHGFIKRNPLAIPEIFTTIGFNSIIYFAETSTNRCFIWLLNGYHSVHFAGFFVKLPIEINGFPLTIQGWLICGSWNLKRLTWNIIRNCYREHIILPKYYRLPKSRTYR
jgi:hypothetical protein